MWRSRVGHLRSFDPATVRSDLSQQQQITPHAFMKAISLLLGFFALAQGFVMLPGARAPLRAAEQAVTTLTPALARPQPLAARVASVQMGLFGLGTPELAVIAGIALLVLGPDQVKKLAKDVGKVSAELKQVPEEFNKGMDIGAKELEAKKGTSPPAADAEEKPPAPPSPPAAA